MTDQVDEEGWAGTFLVEPLLALAGGIIGGALVAAVVARALWVTVRSSGQQSTAHTSHHRGVTA